MFFFGKFHENVINVTEFWQKLVKNRYQTLAKNCQIFKLCWQHPNLLILKYTLYGFYIGIKKFRKIAC